MVIHVILGVAIALVLNNRGLKFRGVYRALFILPVIIPPIIVATVWRHLFDEDNGAFNMILSGIGVLFKIPPDAFKIDWLGQIDDPDLVHPLTARVLRAPCRQHVAGLAPERGRRHGRAPEHPARPVRGGRD